MYFLHFYDICKSLDIHMFAMLQTIIATRRDAITIIPRLECAGGRLSDVLILTHTFHKQNLVSMYAPGYRYFIILRIIPV